MYNGRDRSAEKGSARTDVETPQSGNKYSPFQNRFWRDLSSSYARSENLSTNFENIIKS